MEAMKFRRLVSLFEHIEPPGQEVAIQQTALSVKQRAGTKARS